MDSSFTKVAQKVPQLSGFDKSHQNLLSSKCGTITPILIDELIPGSKVNMNLVLSAQLPPLATDTFMRCDIKVEAFFVPFRLLAGSFESWFTDTAVSFQGSYGSAPNFTDRVGFLPCIGPLSSASELYPKIVGVGKLSDYLGYKERVSGGTPRIAVIPMSAMPFLAYHRVYDDWYRNTLVQRPVFVRPVATAAYAPAPGGNYLCAGTAPYYFYSALLGTAAQNYQFVTEDSLKLSDGVSLYDLRQRNFGLDYFTTATPTPQQGSASLVSFSTAAATGSFSIAALRAANSLQQFAERNNLAGTRYQDHLKARYGIDLKDGVAQRSLFLGGATFPVYSKGIYQSSNDASDSAPSVDSNNPFKTTGAKYGSAAAAGKGLNIQFSCAEPGYLLVNATLVPKVTYSTGIHKRLFHFCGAGSLADLANPILQNVGPQPIYDWELNAQGSAPNVFGYTDRYAEFKTMEDELHGILRDGSSLEAFALQRSFDKDGEIYINSSFLQIPTDYMDQVSAAGVSLSDYGYWLDTYFDYKVSQPLAKYSLPSLQDPAYEHGKTVVMQKGGSRL